MDYLGLKKLITGFLILATITSVGTLIVFNFAGSGAPNSNANNKNDFVKDITPVIDKNALVEPLSNNPLPEQMSGNSAAATATATPKPDPSNLTQNFVQTFTDQVIANNPGGPKVDENGKPQTIVFPTEDYAAQLLSRTVANSNFTIDEKISDKDLKIIANYGPEDVSRYFEAVNSVLSDVASSTARIDVTNQDSIPEAIAVSQLVMESALGKLKAIPAPQPAADFHRGLVKFFANQEKIFELAGNYQIDPLKSMLALKSEEGVVNRDFENLRNKFQKLNISELYQKNGAELSILDKFLGVRVAYAIPVNVIANPADLPHWLLTLVNWAKSFADKAIDWAYKTALRLLVKTLIDQFQNQVVNWIAGNGKPKFITNWQGFFRDAANQALGNAIYKIAPYLCTGIGPLLRVALTPVPSIVSPVRCTLNQVVQNVQNFYNSFQNGGWVAYGATLQPSNNFFGNLIQVNDLVYQQIGIAQKAAELAAQASQGFLPGTEQCVKSHEERGACKNYDETGRCADYETKTVCEENKILTPGAATAHALFGSLDWKIQEINVAQRFEELAAAVIQASINRMMKEGLSRLTEANNPKPVSGGTPAGVPNPGDLASVKSSAAALLNSVQQAGSFNNIQSTINTDNQWLALEPATIVALNQVAAACPSLQTSANQNISQLNSQIKNVTAELGQASSTSFQAFRSAINSATSSVALGNIISELQQANADTSANALAAAQARLQSLQNLKANADNTLSNGCSTPL